jgi:hypothetical protein
MVLPITVRESYVGGIGKSMNALRTHPTAVAVAAVDGSHVGEIDRVFELTPRTEAMLMAFSTAERF